MDIHAQVVVVDAADLTEVSTFWAGVLGGSVDREDDWHMVLDRDGKARIGVQLAPNHVPRSGRSANNSSRCTSTWGSPTSRPLTTR